MTSWLISGGIIVTLVLGLWFQRQEIQGLEKDISDLNTRLMLREAALTKNKTELEQCEATNAANEAEAQRQREAAQRAEQTIAERREQHEQELERIKERAEALQVDADCPDLGDPDFIDQLYDSQGDSGL